ncbi:hypothetical protein MHH81_02255 [Psychrobacillus sp. FSL H8-0484]|uniref:hypothetical protein n=1 Tax=Psychrobacillus sp. FSL H8-0484 TaxID=2921390 RepID=UPI0030FB465D
MGTMCPCGVSVDAFSEDNNVKFEGQNGTIEGNLTYMAEVCITTLATSTLSLDFEDTETPGLNDFTFTANEITSVECNQEGQNCVVTVTGTGTIDGDKLDFVAVFRDQVASAANDNVQSFVITGFFDQNGAAPVEQGSIIALGCQEM